MHPTSRGLFKSSRRFKKKKKPLLSEALILDQLRGDVDEIHQGRLQRAADLPGGVALHGLRRALPATLGWHLRMKVVFFFFVCLVFFN